jgi:putative addiction module component (TIGR02574 family)
MATAKAAASVEALFNEASLLPLDDRAQLADMLLSSLDHSPLSPAWKAEIDRRLAAYDRGEIKAVPGEQVIQSLKEKYGG